MVNRDRINNFLMEAHENFSIVAAWPFLEYLLLMHLFNGYSLQKINKYDGCLINKRVYVDKMPLEERKRRANRAKIDALLPYVNKLTEYFDETMLKDMYRNLSTVKFKRRRLLLIMGVGGVFSAKKNSIVYSLKNSIGHELLHLSSAFYNPKTKERHVGFEQSKGMVCIGRGLTEGYTELLSSRIFNKDGSPDAYYKEVRIAKLFEFFFDNPKDMEKYYFKHNLPGFILYMQKYIPRKKLINILLNLDYINRLSYASPIIMTIKNINISMELYKGFLKTNPSVKKRLAFERVLRENKLVELALNKQKVKLQRNVTPFTYYNNTTLRGNGTLRRAA